MFSGRCQRRFGDPEQVAERATVNITFCLCSEKLPLVMRHKKSECEEMEYYQNNMTGKRWQSGLGGFRNFPNNKHLLYEWGGGGGGGWVGEYQLQSCWWPCDVPHGGGWECSNRSLNTHLQCKSITEAKATVMSCTETEAELAQPGLQSEVGFLEQFLSPTFLNVIKCKCKAVLLAPGMQTTAFSRCYGLRSMHSSPVSWVFTWCNMHIFISYIWDLFLLIYFQRGSLFHKM